MVDGRIVFLTDPARAPELIQKHGGAWVTDPIDVALVIHMGHPRLVIEPFARQAPATVDVLRWRSR